MTFLIIILAACILFDLWYFASLYYIGQLYKRVLKIHRGVYGLVDELTVIIQKMSQIAGKSNDFELLPWNAEDRLPLLSEQVQFNENTKQNLDIFMELHPDVKNHAEYQELVKRYESTHELLMNKITELGAAIRHHEAVVTSGKTKLAAESVHLKPISLGDLELLNVARA